MSLDKLASLLVLILLIEMMVSVGLAVSLADLLAVVSNIRLLVRALLANYVLVPAATLILLYLFRVQPILAVGFLLIAVCPGAPFAPPLTSLARGNVHVSVGSMAILAACSAVLAPVLLSFLIPFAAHGASLKIDTVKIVTTLLMTQLLPLAIGLLVRHKRPQLAQRLQKPANALTGLLSLIVFALVIGLQFQTLQQIRARGSLGICILILLCLLAGWFLAGPPTATRRAMALTTAARNIGVALVIATASFPGSAAVTAVVIFGIFQILLLLAVALAIGRLAPASQPA